MSSLHPSQSIQELRYSVIREMSAMAAEFDNVINLSIGAPDFATPPQIITRAAADAAAGHTHYTPSQGDPELISRLAKRLEEEEKITVPESGILITHGGMGALTACLRTLIEPGDHVLLIEPHFPDYLAHIAFAGGVTVTAVSHAENDFIPTIKELEKAITPQTKLLILNSPNNPTGAVIPGNVLDELAAFAVKHDLYVLSDEVYDRLLYAGEKETIYTRPGMEERTVVIRSFSKSYAMTGWRVGCCFGPQELIGQILKVVNYATACTASISQRAALAALDTADADVEKMRERYRRRVELVHNRLNAMPGVTVAKATGAFYLFADMTAHTDNSREFAIRLLKEQQVIVVPGYAFGSSCEGFVRIACTRSREQLAQAMDRLETFLHSSHEE